MSLNRSETAQKLNVSLTTLDNWRRKGCPHTKTGKQVFFEIAALKRWLDNRSSGELDYTQETSPFECRMGWAVDMDKQDFNGRASLDELKANVKTRVVTLRIPSAEVDYSGAVLALDGTEVGFAPLAVPSPLVDGDFLAMATVANGSHKVGTRLELKGHVGVEAEIVSMPVYDSDRIKVRS